MSRVYLAENTGIRRSVALKVIHVDREVRARFGARLLSEARVLARVQCTCVISVYDVCYTDTGDPCIVAEYVDGVSLAGLIKTTGRLAPAVAIRLVLQVASALECVHSFGVVHRDVKPSNVLLTRTPSGLELAKVADFGLSSAVLPEGQFGGSIIGTPGYMAPEQARGDPVDHRADIYSLGCVLCAALSGRSQQDCHRPTMAAAAWWKRALASAGLPKCVSEPISLVVDRCMAEGPSERYQSARGLSDSLLEASEQAGISRRELRLLELLEAGAVLLPRADRRRLENGYYGPQR